MDDSPLPCIAFFLVCLIGSFICSAAETAFASVGKAKMMSLSEAGNKRARRVLSVIDRFDEALTANLICNNIFNIGCATAATVLAVNIGGAGAVAVATLISTAIIFISAEMFPKKFAKDCPEFTAMAIAPVMLLMTSVLRPFIMIFTSITRLAARLFLGKGYTEITYTENEVEALIETVAEDKETPPEHGSLIRSAFGFSAIPVSDIETSWKNTCKLPVDADRSTVISVARSVQHTRFPVIEDGRPVGILHIRQYLRACVADGTDSIRSVMAPPFFVNAETPADHALSEMSREKTSLAFVLRSDGCVSGIVTVEDILEYLVGDMDDETDTEDNI